MSYAWTWSQIDLKIPSVFVPHLGILGEFCKRIFWCARCFDSIFKVYHKEYTDIS